MAGPGDEVAAAARRGRGHFRASQADREQAVEALKTAFAEDRLTKDEFDLRVGQALASRTYAELAATAADILARPAAAGPAGTPARTLATAARRSGICLLVPLALVGLIALTHAEGLAGPVVLCAIAAVVAASGFLGYGIVDAWQQRRSRGQPPGRPGRDARGVRTGRPDSTSRDPAMPGARPDRTRADARALGSRPGRLRSSGRGVRAPRGIRPVPGAV